MDFEERKKAMFEVVGPPRPRRARPAGAPPPPRKEHYEPTSRSVYRSCTSKVRYRDDNAADRAAKKRGLRAYFCTYCQGFHLTSQKVT